MTSCPNRVAPIPLQWVMGPIDVSDLKKRILNILIAVIDYCEGGEMSDTMDLSVVWDIDNWQPKTRDNFGLWLLCELNVLKDYLNPHFKTDFVLHPGLQGADMTISTLG